MKYYQTIINENGNIAVDDTILVKDVPAAAGSHILEGFKPLFSAEAVTRLQQKGYTVSGKTCVGEFGLDLVGEFSYSAEQEGRLYGAAAELVKAGKVKAALSVDMNGAPRRAAAISDVVFLKPTYGTVSRYGVISCAASGEQIGVSAKGADEVAEIMNVIAGHDEKDGTSLPEKSYDYSADINLAGKKVAVITDLTDKADEAVRGRVAEFTDALKKNGVQVEEKSCDFFGFANTAWQILMSAETCNNISRYDGVKFGYRSKEYRNIDELYINSRTEGFNFLTKAVILYGSDALSKTRYKDCYEKSLKIRRIVTDRLSELFGQYDAIVMPACSTVSYENYDISDAFKKTFAESIFTSSANLTGIPAIVGGSVMELKDVTPADLNLSIGVIIVGLVVSAVVGFLSIKMVQWLLKSDKFKIFMIYTFVLGVIVLLTGITEHIIGQNIVDMLFK